MSAPAVAEALRAVVEPLDPGSVNGAGADFVWEHAGTHLVGFGAALRVPASAADAVLRTIGHDGDLPHPGAGPVAVGALPFSGTRDALLTVPARAIVRTPTGAWETRISTAAPDAVPGPPTRPVRRSGTPGTARLVDAFDRGRWAGAVQQALDAVAAGELTKAVLARHLLVETQHPVDRDWLLARLRDREPGRYLFADGTFVGASPELLVSRDGDRLRSRPLAGSSQSADGAALAALAASAKDHHEHAVVVDAMRAVFEQFARDVEVSDPEIIELADLGHLATSIRARATSTTPSALGLALELHPTPAVAGTPTAAALAHIAALEGDRGRYAGPVGWVDAAGNGQFAVALRAAEIDDGDARRVTLRAGAGIVAGSDADAEWSEIDAKFAPILHALGVS